MEEAKNTRAAGTPPVATKEDTIGGTASDEGKTEVKSFSQDQLDKIVKERVEREQEKFKRELAERVAEERKEAERLAALDAEAREKEKIEKQERERQQREHDLTIRENRIDAAEKLRELQLPTELVDLVIDADVSKMSEKIDALNRVFVKALQDGIKAQLKGTTPKDPTSQPSTGEAPKKEILPYF
jgi:flagellar biosynthesis GTPase FlhF